MISVSGIHGYTVNDRLFTEPLNADSRGNSVCPVCLQSRKEPTPQSPGFVRYLDIFVRPVSPAGNLQPFPGIPCQQ